VVPSASAWCLATVEDRAWWGGLWADRVVSALADRMLERGLATAAWRRWAAAPDRWFVIVNSEMLCTP
jgi:hypothetical protein